MPTAGQYTKKQDLGYVTPPEITPKICVAKTPTAKVSQTPAKKCVKKKKKKKDRGTAVSLLHWGRDSSIKLGSKDRRWVVRSLLRSFRKKVRKKSLDTKAKLTLLQRYSNFVFVERTYSKTHAKAVRDHYNFVKQSNSEAYQLGFICWACGGRAVHRHHIIPISKGGTNSLKNLVPLCIGCHQTVRGHFIP